MMIASPSMIFAATSSRLTSSVPGSWSISSSDSDPCERAVLVEPLVFVHATIPPEQRARARAGDDPHAIGRRRIAKQAHECFRERVRILALDQETGAPVLHHLRQTADA